MGNRYAVTKVTTHEVGFGVSLLITLMDTIAKIKKSLELLAGQYQVEWARRNKPGNIILGRIFSVGQYYPLTLAEQLFTGREDYLVFVDHHIKIGNKNLYPDLLVIDRKTKRVVAMVEVKLDLGWFKNPIEGVGSLIKNYDLPGSRQVTIKYNGAEEQFTFDDKMVKIFFVVTLANDHGRFKEVKDKLEQAGFLVVHCLEIPHHPNNNKFDQTVIEADINKNANDLQKAFHWLK